MRISEWLRQQSEPAWTQAVTHRFGAEVFAGTIDDRVLRRYLVQDYQFVDRFVALLGGCVSTADRADSRMVLAGQLGVVAGAENDYFRRAFDALSVPEAERQAPALAQPTRQLQELMDQPRLRQDYAGALTVLTVAEWVYAEWARPRPDSLPEHFLYAEWVQLHNSAAFHRWVGWLRQELDRVATSLEPGAVEYCRQLFVQATELELEFFHACYQ